MIVNRTADIARRCGITTIAALAARAGLAYNTAHALYTGRTTRIDHETLNRLCAALDVQPGDLFVYVPHATERDATTDS
ncbi:MAG TPA: helix-turn-helix transcriptional regulator [Roseiflexaceae bacterium]|nr:helix-turn-helix transcriptional regulator [Roseiflexaceae bacterium]